MRGNADGLTKRQLLPATVAFRSRALRQKAGEPERRLWSAIREAFPDARFRRQVPFRSATADRPYHADFCSHAAKLVVEVDGDDHASRDDRDAIRTRSLENEGYRVIRFANADVMTNIDGVLATIAAAVAAAQKGRS